MNQQKIFNFKIKQNFDRDDFFVSKSNELAHKVLLNLTKPEKYIHLKGHLKSGKTHLGLLWKRINNAIFFNYNDYDLIMSQKKNVFIDNFTYGIDEEKCITVSFRDTNTTMINSLSKGSASLNPVSR